MSNTLAYCAKNIYQDAVFITTAVKLRARKTKEIWRNLFFRFKMPPLIWFCLILQHRVWMSIMVAFSSRSVHDTDTEKRYHSHSLCNRDCFTYLFHLFKINKWCNLYKSSPWYFLWDNTGPFWYKYNHCFFR